MVRLILLSLLPTLLAAADDWVKFTSGPFEVLTDAGPRAGRETMVRYLEFRHALGQIVGEPELQTPLPVRILVFKNPRGWTSTAPIAEGRDRYNVVLPDKAPPSPAIYTELARLFLKSNTAQMPPAFERGLISFFSTTAIDGIRITVGAPPPQPDADWARIHLLVVSPEYFGKLRVLLANLRRGVDEEPAYRNAFSKPRAEVEAAAKQHLAAGNFTTTSLNSRPLAERDFPERPVSDADARLARADLLMGKQSTAEYQALLKDRVKIAEAEEGLGLIALREGAKDEARQHFSLAMEAGTPSARAYIEYAKLEPDQAKAEQALLKAAGINPKLDEPFALMAQRDTDPRKRLEHWKAAAERNPRNASYWQSLAEAYLADHNYTEASKAWRQGEQAAIDPAVREKMRAARVAIEQQRLDYEAAEKQRAADEEARDLERLKAQARAEVKALEARANKGTAKSDAPVVPWWDGPKPDKRVSGTLVRIDCLGNQARLTLQPNSGAALKLLVTDPGKIILSGGGEQSLGCGAQKPRRVTVDYWAKSNARLGTTGEVAMIEFQ
jgi:tetratricopeptide (TPR) repeat protein